MESFTWLCETRGSLSSQVRAGSSSSTRSWLDCIALRRERGDVEIVKLLLEAGADPYIENEMAEFI